MDLKNATSYRRRYYLVEGAVLDQAKKIELIVKVDGRTLVHLQAREPGMLAFVSKPDDQGIELHVGEVAEQAYRDITVPEISSEDGLLPWQVDALALE